MAKKRDKKPTKPPKWVRYMLEIHPLLMTNGLNWVYLSLFFVTL